MLPISQLSGIISQSGTQVVIAPGTPVTTLQVRATGAGTFPYSATVLPLEGQVPTGSTLQCVEDTSLRACILSTHSDGSASVVVVSGTTTVSLNQTKTLSLQTATIVGETNLNASRISSLLTDISLNFGSPYGTATISDFSSPERIWWATPTTICARYRIQPPTLSGTQLEAVIDVHAYASSTNALVEIVVENCKMNTASPSAPSAASYTSAVLTINGNTITTVNGNGAPEGYHAPFRSWYSSSWLQGDPGLRITQLYTDLQKHPLLYKMDQASTVDMAGYAGDAYSPWATGRQRAGGMGGGGDHPSIGPLTLWDAHWLQSGDYRAAKASEVSALAILGFNINYRDSSTGLVPDASLLVGKHQTSSGNWPTTNLTAGDQMAWDVPHHPAVGLIAFLCRPSPVYIELAQKVAVWNGTWNCDPAALTYGWDGPGAGVTDPTGMFGASCFLRGRAWAMRSLAHATFLSLGGSAWRSGGQAWLDKNRRFLASWTTNPKALLNTMWEDAPTALHDMESSMRGFQVAMWMYHFFVGEIHKVASAKLLTGTAQTAMDALADWCVLQPVRYVNELPNGGWRSHPYRTAIGRTSDESDIDSASTWTAQMAWQYSDSPSSVTGPWMGGLGDESTYAVVETRPPDSIAGGNYPSAFWYALVAATERKVPGYDIAWNTVQAGITNLSSWRTGFAADPRWGSTPRVTIPSTGLGIGSNAGSYNSGTSTWTPGRDSAGVVNASSWALVPTNTWVKVAGSRIDTLDSAIKAAIPGWRDYGDWADYLNSWSGFVADTAGNRFWMFGGGHNNSSNNGLYRFDAFKMAWAIECLPSDPAIWDSGYTGGGNFTGYYPSLVAAATQYSAGTWQPINGTLYDESPDGKPTARHTYQSMVYMSDSNRLAMACRRMWFYDLNTGTWNYKRAIHDEYGDGSTGGNQLGEHCVALYDFVGKTLFFSSSGSGGSDNINYDVASSTWSSWTPRPDYWNRAGTLASAMQGNNATVIVPPNQAGYAGNFPNGLFMQWDVVTRTLTTYTGLQFGQGLSATNFNGGGFDSPGALYVPSINRYWLWTLEADNITLGHFEIDPTTSPPTLSRSARTSGSVPDYTGAVFGRHGVYILALDSVIVFGSLADGAALYRFS